MITFILAVVAALITIGCAVAAARIKPDSYSSATQMNNARDTRRGYVLVTIVGFAATLGLGGWSMIYPQSVGQASVIVNMSGTIAQANDKPGLGFKAPWQSRSTWDLFSRPVNYAGKKDAPPSYTNGEVQGQQVTSSVRGGAQVDFDFSAVYSVSGPSVKELYEKYRSQERFAAQVVEPSILSVVRAVPPIYSPVEFRGDKRGEAQDVMLTRLNERLEPYGVKVTMVNLQNISFSEDVEASIKQVEVAQQNEAKAQAELRAKEVSAKAQIVEAEAKAQATVEMARGQAEANRMLAESLTEPLLRNAWIEAIKESGNAIVVPDGSTPFVQVPTPTE